MAHATSETSSALKRESFGGAAFEHVAENEDDKGTENRAGGTEGNQKKKENKDVSRRDADTTSIYFMQTHPERV